jgi:hypothetical protein
MARPYDEDSEDQNIQPKDVLNYELKDEVSLDDWVYDEQFADAILNYGDVEPSLKDLYALCMSHIFQVLNIPQFWALARPLLLSGWDLSQ